MSLEDGIIYLTELFPIDILILLLLMILLLVYLCSSPTLLVLSSLTHEGASTDLCDADFNMWIVLNTFKKSKESCLYVFSWRSNISTRDLQMKTVQIMDQPLIQAHMPAVWIKHIRF